MIQNKNLEHSLYVLSKNIDVLSDIELKAAIDKHGLQENIGIDFQYLILIEEIGEIAKAIIEKDYKNAREEIAQSIAMLKKLWWYIIMEDDKVV